MGATRGTRASSVTAIGLFFIATSALAAPARAKEHGKTSGPIRGTLFSYWAGPGRTHAATGEQTRPRRDLQRPRLPHDMLQAIRAAFESAAQTPTAETAAKGAANARSPAPPRAARGFGILTLD